MSKRNILFVAGLGFAAGFIAHQQMNHYQKVTPEKALKQAKEAFKKAGPISGSWIYMKPEEIEKNGLMYNAYRGGVTRNIDGENKQFEFYVDVETGAIIDSIPTAS
ncbi:PepSY domain-containing protein [Virgibacillus alimentarius]|uniref:Small secreted protein n=1 Tax=Virgibacillus alimentarius TaxID=698769 RepID=A0ABS4SCE5_9BACI|nr:PepSY domain-containing protein [Virgibacillus alimentarius]MBP2259169.1 putative small secreted protein [Virgibacillus alimentarius]